ncbi:hypothetical protein [Kitasatospora sp. NPDC086791]|uniref:hypothetical protein n=1 Tax=Kitasatospora sp. NPDC086791 TaxID=3155178 RepID=UPI0034467940
MLNRLLRRRQVLTVAELSQCLNRALRQASRSWLGPQPPERQAIPGSPTDFQRPLEEAYRAQTAVLADVHELAAAARAHLPDTDHGRRTNESIDWAVYLLGQAETALRRAALETCPDADRLPERRN